MTAVSFIVILLCFVYRGNGVAYSLVASRVYGQNGAFTTTGIVAPVSGPQYVNTPLNVHVSVTDGATYTSEGLNGNRVLSFPSGGGGTAPLPTAVYGQMGSFTTTTAIVPVNASSLSNPDGIASHPTQLGAILVTDKSNNRCLFYPAAGVTNAPTIVYGQPDFVSNAFNRGLAAPTASTLGSPSGVAYDASTSPPGLWIADSNNHRVLYFALGATAAATRVYGQLGSFVTRVSNNGGLSASSMNFPTALAVGRTGDGRLFVADTSNSRILVFAAGPSTVAAQIIGGLTGSPQGVAVDGDGGIFVSEANFNRVLYFGTAAAAPDLVFGQYGSFTTTTPNTGGAVTAQTLANPLGLALDPVTENLYVADFGNSRVLMYARQSTAIVVVGTNQSQTVQGNLVIAQNASLTLQSGASLTVLGNTTINGALLVTEGGVLFNVSGALVLDGATSNLTVVGNFTTATTTTAPIVIATYAQIQGTFNTIQVDAPQRSCDNALSAVPTYGATTLSVVITVQNTCSQQLSSSPSSGNGSGGNIGLIVGVSLGCIAIAALSMVVLVTVMRKSRKTKDAAANAKLREIDLKRLAATTTTTA
jgi:sugar lactone lactonase YvrE